MTKRTQKFLFILITCFVTLQVTDISARDRTTTRIRKAVDDIWIIDTHEHLVTEKGRMQISVGFFYFIRNYLAGDIKSAGMTDTEEDFIFDEKNLLDCMRNYAPQNIWAGTTMC